MKRCGTPIGPPKPSLPVPVYGEDFSFLVRAPTRLRLDRGRRDILH